MSADERVNAAWVLAAAPKSVRAMVAEGWRPVMHECVAPPQWNHDHKGTVDLTADDIAWFNGADVVAGEPESPADLLKAHAQHLAADPQIEATCAEIDRRLAAGEPLDDLLGPGVTAEEFRRQHLDAPESTPAAERWCAKHRDGWCAVVPNEEPAEGTFSLNTLCGYGITLPWGFDHRVPDCPDCLAVGDGPAVERTPEEKFAALTGSLVAAAVQAIVRHSRAADTQEAHDA